MVNKLFKQILKHNRLLAWLLILSLIFSLGGSVWSEDTEPDEAATSETEEEDNEDEDIPYDIPLREEEEVFELMKKVGESDSLELYILDEYKYEGWKDAYEDFDLYDNKGNLVEYEEDMFLDDEGNNNVPLYDEKGNPILDRNGNHKIEPFTSMNRKTTVLGTRLMYVELNDEYEVISEEYVYDENGDILEYEEGMFDDEGEVPIYDKDGELVDTIAMDNFHNHLQRREETLVNLTYVGVVSTPVDKVKEEGKFAVRVKENGYIWWSSPINAAHDPAAKSAHVDNLSSPVVFRAGNPASHSASNFRSNSVAEYREPGQPKEYYFKNAIEEIEEISTLDGGFRFHYNFPDRSTRIIMEVVLDGDSVLVTIPQDGIVEDKIVCPEDAGSVMLTLSLLNSFGAAPKGEDGYIVVPDGSGAVIEFDNGKTNTAQYAGQVYGRDYAVSQRFAPPVNEQVNLPVYGIVRDSGENALVAIAEKGDENAIIRAAVPGQGQRVTLQGVRNAIANSTSYNVAWFDFTMRTVDAFYIGTEFVELSIYEPHGIKTGDIAVRYYPLAGSEDDPLSYVDVADKYRDYLIEHKDVKPVDSENDSKNTLPMYLTINGGTVKTHSIAGFPVNKQTAATKYSEAEEILNRLNEAGIEQAVIAYNDFNSSNVKREVSKSVQYSRMLGGRNGFKSLSDTVNSHGYTMYPSMGFMEFHKAGSGYIPLLHTAREVTRSRAIQQRYELAFGTPDSLQSTWSILSPFYFTDVFDNIVDSFQKEGITNISLDQATTLLYSDFSRKNPSGNMFFNRRDTVEVLTQGFKKLNDAGVSIMAQSANAYALPYVSHISNVPLYSSNYDTFDYDIPFQQIVLNGLIPYSSNPFNASSNLDEMTLLALSSGTPIHYEFIYESPGNFNDSDYNKKFYADFDSWMSEAVDNYKKFNGYIGDTVGDKIISHERLSVHEIETVFEGGKTVYVNLETEEVKVSKGGGRQ